MYKVVAPRIIQLQQRCGVVCESWRVGLVRTSKGASVDVQGAGNDLGAGTRQVETLSRRD